MTNEVDIHNQLLNIASQYHPDVATLITENGVFKLRKSKDKDLFRFLARTVTGQQLSKAAAQTIWQRVENLEVEKAKPLMSFFEKRNEARLRECGLSKNKVNALLELKKSFTRGEISYDSIKKSNYEELSKQIIQLKGLGQWSADMVAMFFLALPDVWPETDAALLRGMRILIGNRKSPIKAATLYRPYRTYLANHIWMGLDTGKL